MYFIQSFIEKHSIFKISEAGKSNKSAAMLLKSEAADKVLTNSYLISQFIILINEGGDSDDNSIDIKWQHS